MLLSALQKRVTKRQVSLDEEAAAAAAAISAHDLTKQEKVRVNPLLAYTCMLTQNAALGYVDTSHWFWTETREVL